MKAGAMMFSLVVIVDSFLAGYFLGFHSRSVDVIDPNLKPAPPPTVAAPAKPATATPAKPATRKSAKSATGTSAKPTTKKPAPPLVATQMKSSKGSAKPNNKKGDSHKSPSKSVPAKTKGAG